MALAFAHDTRKHLAYPVPGEDVTEVFYNKTETKLFRLMVLHGEPRENSTITRDAIILQLKEKDLEGSAAIIRIPRKIYGKRLNQKTVEVHIRDLENKGLSSQEILKRLLRSTSRKEAYVTLPYENKTLLEGSRIPSYRFSEMAVEFPQVYRPSRIFEVSKKTNHPLTHCVQSHAIFPTFRPRVGSYRVVLLNGFLGSDEAMAASDSFSKDIPKDKKISLAPHTSHGSQTAIKRISDNARLIQFRLLDLDPSSPLQTKVRNISLCVSDSGLMIQDEMNSPFLNNVAERISHLNMESQDLANPLSLAFEIMNMALQHNHEVASTLNSGAEKLAHEKKLPHEVLERDGHDLEDTIDYLRRKINGSTAGIEMSLKRLASNNPGIREKVEEVVANAVNINAVIQNTIGQLDASEGFVNRARTRAQNETTHNIHNTTKVFTILIGYSIPPILLDIGYKFVHHEHSPQFFAAAMVVAGIGHLLATTRLWGNHKN